jgi:hypothetical protein
MDYALLSIIFGSGTILGVVITSLFNLWMKKLEFKEKEKDREFRIKEIFINNAVETLQETQEWLYRINSAVDGYLVKPSEQSKKQARDNCLKLFKEYKGEWYFKKSVYMEKNVRKALDLFLHFASEKIFDVPEHFPTPTYWDAFHKMIVVLQEALDKVAKEYNPLHDLDLGDLVKKIDDERKKIIEEVQGKKIT